MKLYHPACSGVFVALLSSLVASQEVSMGGMEAPCSRIEDCPKDMYCSALSNTCLEMSKCNEVADCKDSTNIFASALCMGTRFCEAGVCGIDCTVMPPEDGDVMPPLVVGTGECATDSDCGVDPGREPEMFCASDGICEPITGCATVDDCVSESNVFPIPACMGGMECNDRKCFMNCIGSDAMLKCDTTADCLELDPDNYCAGNGKCLPMGGCDLVKDCDSPDNFFMMAECVGEKTCEEGSCGIKCDEFCTTSDDCQGEETYCAGNGKCLPMGGCDLVKDCDSPDNFFMLAACVGEKTCEEGSCGIKCDEFCTTSDDCQGEETYCAGNGKCLPMGGCDRVKDCDSPDNFFMLAACEGEKTCEEGSCGIECDSTSGNEALPVDLAISCTQDSDCSITTSTTRSSEGAKYCAQGVCTKHGDCMSDSDCHNPSNILWNDKRCLGYLECTNEGMCDRICGQQCKNGSRAVECFTDPCSIDTCPGAASCYASICGCVAEYFNAAGEIVDCESQALGESKAVESKAVESKAVGDDQSKDRFCTASTDCKGEETYCAGNGKCLPMGDCDLVKDCSSPDNFFMLAACEGEKTCEEGMCGIECDTGESQKNTSLSIDSSAIGSSVSLSAVLVAVLVAAVLV